MTLAALLVGRSALKTKGFLSKVWRAQTPEWQTKCKHLGAAALGFAALGALHEMNAAFWSYQPGQHPTYAEQHDYICQHGRTVDGQKASAIYSCAAYPFARGGEAFARNFRAPTRHP